MTRGLVGRADFLRALAAAQAGETEQIATLFGFRRGDSFQPVLRQLPSTPPSTPLGGKRQPTPAPQPVPAQALAPTPFWKPVEFVLRSPASDEPLPRPPAARPVWRNAPTRPPPRLMLAHWRDLAPRLRNVIAAKAPTDAVDVERIVHAMGRGRLLLNLPRRTRRGWGAPLHVIVDRSYRLVPYWDDQQAVVAALRALLPPERLAFGIFDEACDEPRSWGQAPGGHAYTPPEKGVVLVLGDLGCLDHGGREALLPWLRLGRRAAAAGCGTAALLPCPLSRCPAELRQVWRVEPWERTRSAGQPDPATLRARAEHLLTLLAPAIRIEPGLLRAVRRCLGPDVADTGTEADVWQHAALSSPSAIAASLRPEAARRLRAAFVALPPEAQRMALERLREWRWRLPDEIWFEEVLNLDPAVHGALHDCGDLDDARSFFETIDAAPDLVTGDAVALQGWLKRAGSRASAPALALPAFARALAAAAEADLDYRLPAGVDPIHIRADGKSVRPLELREQAGHLVVSDQSGGDGSLLGLLRGGNGLVQVGQWVAVPEGAGAFWALGRVPAWAEDWGTDASGPWASFSVTARDGSRVTQRLRWCPPGRFQMGSPDNEEERWSDEGPLHEVTIADGFWMFETACTEALWEAVTGQAPEPRRGPGFPVTGVSWNDAQDFVRALNATKPGLDLGLPTEAWWEYACRAGTETPYSFGKTISKDQACYESRAPVPVGSLPPNTWGLHEMHGNVWEWCTDHWHGDYEGAPTDGSAWIAPRAAAIRVVRGGSWDVTARSVRAACRYGLDPAFRYGNLGFRCARVQAASGSDRAEQVAAPEAPASRSGAERRRPQGPTSDATLLRGGVAAPAVLPGAAEPLGRNALNLTWASRSGRDRFGIFADLTPPHTEVTQRLRWIPRGRFQMGSPASEEGRADWEGPQREVALAAGFWLFDTPCTQALWEGIMGENPSRFRSALRPVEQVSFDDVRAFLTRINHRVPGLDLLLPSEAQWEYACRAGTTTATYAGEMQILGENNAPILDTIAWYGGNSGVGFELKKGEDSGSWRNKQYPHKRAGTRLVAQKAPNPWGLYDMLGNVWEWCADHWHDSYEGAPSDGSAWLDSQGAASRVVRGGSWLDYARYVRAACRDWAVPAFSLGNLGFRCARVQAASESDPAEQVAAPEAPASRSGAERRRPQGPTSDATLLRVGVSAPAPLPRAPALLIRTDREELHLRQVSRADPDLAWASGLGRDRHGLFADLTVPETDVTQRLRWIPPGRFTMGSPESEEGRFDWEGPQHEVTLAEGFWLFDTPCTQAVWNAVMGNYPSEFRSPTRPVEQVTFDDAQGFLVRLNGLVPGLSLVLPSEAEWEYACRAGTHTATYAGEMQILGENNSPVLDAIAWYGGNSGVDFDLENGRDTKGWPNKQYPHEKAGTHPVAGKAPNAWGLYDMLGNVWEWCADHWHDSYEGAPTDGTAWIAPQGAADRVVRGGSWLGNARLVRAAYRGRNVPAVSSGYLGFRCARVQVAGEAERRAGRSKPSERSERAATPRPERSGARARSTPISKRK